jgi:hypothetical protein
MLTLHSFQKIEVKTKMKKKLLHTVILLVFISISNLAFSQVIFEPGYIIDNDGNKTECLIKNHEWTKSPGKIETRSNDTATIVKIDLETIIEFKVANFKFIKVIVDIDQSSQAINKLSNSREPDYKRDTVFLRVLVEGLANLYFYGTRDLYFFNANTSDIKQLIYKEYLVDGKISKNYSFRNQLSNDLKCSKITRQTLKATGYNYRDLKKIVEIYNECMGSAYQSFDMHKSKNSFNLFIHGGGRYSTFYMTFHPNTSINVDYGGDFNPVFGLSAEYVLPFNKNKWAFMIRTVYQSYHVDHPREDLNRPVEYKSIETSIGLKYYMFLSEKTSVFLTGNLVFADAPIDSFVSGIWNTLEVSSNFNLNFGIGYNYNNRWSFEAYYSTKRDLLRDYKRYSGSYKSVTVVLGINIL